jgi:hypothetical protein
MTDLSAVTTLLESVYSNRGPKPRDPASLLRSYLLLLMTNSQMGITDWIDEMKRTPIYATLSSFPFDDLPGVGTFYDFFDRLWPAASKHIKPKKQRRLKSKAKKGKKKGQKAPTTTPGRVERLVKWMLRHADTKTALPADKLFDFFQFQIIAVSAKLGLLGDLSAFSAAGDGTPVAAYPRSKPSCNCRARGTAECNHPHLLKLVFIFHDFQLAALDFFHHLPSLPG